VNAPRLKPKTKMRSPDRTADQSFMITGVTLRASKTSCAGEDFKRLEIFRADAVVVDRDLRGEARIVSMAVQVDAFEQFENVGAAAFDRGIAGAVGTDDDVLGHGTFESDV